MTIAACNKNTPHYRSSHYSNRCHGVGWAAIPCSGTRIGRSPASKPAQSTLQVVDGGCCAVRGHREQVLPQHDGVVAAGPGGQLSVWPALPRALDDVEHVREQSSRERLKQATSACTEGHEDVYKQLSRRTANLASSLLTQMTGHDGVTIRARAAGVEESDKVCQDLCGVRCKPAAQHA